MLRSGSAFTRWLCGIWLLLCCLLPSTPASAVDYFGRPVATPAASAPVATAAPQPIETPSVLSQLPLPARKVIGKLVQWQSQLNAALRAQLQHSRAGGGSAAAWAIVLISFVYGVLHAAGPGHGKVVIGSYFLTQRARVLQGVALSAWAATIQALCAIVLVGGLAMLLGTGSLAILNHAATLEIVSYAILGGMGLLMLWRLAHGLDTCGCEPDGAWPSKGSPLRAPLRRNGGVTGKVVYRSAGPTRNAAKNWRQMALAGAAVGLRPCTGAILVLIFCLANGIFMTGVLSTFAMAVGVAITVSLISLGSMGINRLLPAAHGRRGGWQRALSWTGASLIALFGVLQTVLLLTGILPPTLG